MEYPEHEKLEKIADKSQTIGEFLDWLAEEKELSICGWDNKNGRFFKSYIQSKTLLAEFFNIDQKKLEGEKQAMLGSIRSA